MALRDDIRALRTRRYLGLALTVCVLCAVLIVVVALYRLQVSRQVTAEPAFDPHRCVRFFHLNRVYAIRPQPGRQQRIWCATAVGLRVFDTDRARWRRFGMDHGLPGLTISDVAFYRDILWAGTWEGVVWFDSTRQRFRKVAGPPAVRSGRTLAITATARAGVFVSMDQHGVFRIPDTAAAAQRVSLPVADEDRVTLLAARGDSVLIGAEDQRLYTYIPSTGALHAHRFAGGRSEKTLLWDIMWRDTSVYVATSDNGLWKKAGADTVFTRVENAPVRGGYVFAEEEDGFWCGTPQGLWRYHDRNDAWVQFVPPHLDDAGGSFEVVAVANTPQRVWYGSMTEGAGFVTKDRVEWKPLRAGGARYNVDALAAGDSLLWTGYGYNGGYADRFFVEDMQYDKNYDTRNGIRDPQIQTLRVRGSRMYYGGYTGFGYYDGTDNTSAYFDHTNGKLPHEDISDILFVDPAAAGAHGGTAHHTGAGKNTGSAYTTGTAAGKSGASDTSGSPAVFLASGYGLLYSPRLDADAQFHSCGPTRQDRVTCMGHDAPWLFYGTLIHGIKAFHTQDSTLHALYNPGSRITGMAVYTRRDTTTLIVGAKTHGLYRIVRHDTTVVRAAAIPAPFDFSSYDIHIMAFAANARIVVLGTRAHGCLVYAVSDQRWGRLTRMDGLVSDRIRSVACDGRYIWIGSHGGITRIDRPYAMQKAFSRMKEEK
jgi:hypothetical protein